MKKRMLAKEIVLGNCKRELIKYSSVCSKLKINKTLI